MAYINAPSLFLGAPSLILCPELTLLAPKREIKRANIGIFLRKIVSRVFFYRNLARHIILLKSRLLTIGSMAIQRPLELNVRRTATDFNKILCRQVNEKKNERNIPVKPTLDTDFY